MGEPASAEEYADRFIKNQRITGFGIDGVRMHVPCPFCAAPDVLEHGILETEDAYAAGATCAECGRAFRAIFKREEHGEGQHSTAFSFVQTSGPDPSPWVAESIPRETAGEPPLMGRVTLTKKGTEP